MIFDHEHFAAALRFALQAHAGHSRKGSTIPYASHLLQVAGLVLEYGGSTEQAVAALLHDTLEDCADVTYALLAEQFGVAVADMVRDCTDTVDGDTPEHKRPWRQRKEAYLQQLQQVGQRSALVIGCDKRHNLGTMVADIRVHGIDYLQRFSAGAPEQQWYFRSVLTALRAKLPPRLTGELEQTLALFIELTAAS